MMIRVLLFAFPFLFFSCSLDKPVHTQAETGDTINFAYAELINVIDFGKYKEVRVKNPWGRHSLLQRYFLLPKTAELPKALESEMVVRTPLEKSVVCSSVHLGLLEEMDAYASVSGVCDFKFLTSKNIIADVKAGRISDLGSSMSPDVERVLELSPDAFLVSPFEDAKASDLLKKAGVNVIECAEYLERHPLGRAEWMKLYGMLYGREREADSIFTTVENSYCTLRDSILSVKKKRPTVLYGLKYGSAWYVPGGKSQTAILITDAGGRYFYSEDVRKKTVELSPETVFDEGRLTDVWVFNYAQQTLKTLEELKDDFPLYSHFKPYKTGDVYGCNTNFSRYYDEVPFHPELLLADLSLIFSIEKDERGTLRYFEKLK